MTLKMQAAVVEQFAVNAKRMDAIDAVKKATDGGAHGVLITAPSFAAFNQGVGMTRKCGTCVLVGLPPGDVPTPLFDVVANCITLRGSFVGNRRDMAETRRSLQRARSGRASNCSRCRRSTTSSRGWRTATCPRGSCSTSRRIDAVGEVH